MYDNMSYTQIKELNEEQKIEVWSELHKQFPDNKELAKKLGISPIVSSNAIKRYVLGEHIGRVKKEKSENGQVQTQAQPEEIKPKRKYNRKPKEDETIITLPSSKDLDKEIYNESDNTDTFSIIINKVADGENVQILLNGIANTLLKDQQYTIEINISEK